MLEVVWLVVFFGFSIFAVIFEAIRDFIGPFGFWGIKGGLASSFFSLLITCDPTWNWRSDFLADFWDPLQVPPRDEDLNVDRLRFDFGLRVEVRVLFVKIVRLLFLERLAFFELDCWVCVRCGEITFLL